MNRTFVIAEAGSCHDRSMAKAFALIAAAAIAGADAVKFQFWSSADVLARRRRVPDEYRSIYHRYAVPAHWLFFLKAQCDQVGIEFMCSTYLPQDVAVVAPLVKRFKISSFEAGDGEFARAHNAFMEGRELIVSLGMNGDPDRWIGHRGVRLLHCVSAYPAPPEAMNLRVFLGDWGEPCDPAPTPFAGLSDHSRHPWMGALAVASGAEILETHLRLHDTDPQNPDYATAFTPAEFAGYVQNVRFAERVMGDGVKALQACEREMAHYRVGGTS